jgi:hypothetical protein
VDHVYLLELHPPDRAAAGWIARLCRFERGRDEVAAVAQDAAARDIGRVFELLSEQLVAYQDEHDGDLP